MSRVVLLWFVPSFLVLAVTGCAIDDPVPEGAAACDACTHTGQCASPLRCRQFVCVAEGANWMRRRAASNLSDATVVSGRGIGLGTHLQSWGAAVADVEVHKDTGQIVVTHMYGAIDAGLAVNPGNVESQISGQLVQAVSRMLLEEITFNETNVTSLDWNSYPILRFQDCPEITPIVVQRIDEPSSGAGEEVMAAAAGAIANAFFDATGIQMEEYPMTPVRVLAALEGLAGGPMAFA